MFNGERLFGRYMELFAQSVTAVTRIYKELLKISIAEKEIEKAKDLLNKIEELNYRIQWNPAGYVCLSLQEGSETLMRATMDELGIKYYYLEAVSLNDFTGKYIISREDYEKLKASNEFIIDGSGVFEPDYDPERDDMPDIPEELQEEMQQEQEEKEEEGEEHGDKDGDQEDEEDDEDEDEEEEEEDEEEDEDEGSESSDEEEDDKKKKKKEKEKEKKKEEQKQKEEEKKEQQEAAAPPPQEEQSYDQQEAQETAPEEAQPAQTQETNEYADNAGQQETQGTADEHAQETAPEETQPVQTQETNEYADNAGQQETQGTYSESEQIKEPSQTAEISPEETPSQNSGETMQDQPSGSDQQYVSEQENTGHYEEPAVPAGPGQEAEPYQQPSGTKEEPHVPEPMAEEPKTGESYQTPSGSYESVPGTETPGVPQGSAETHDAEPAPGYDGYTAQQSQGNAGQQTSDQTEQPPVSPVSEMPQTPVFSEAEINNAQNFVGNMGQMGTVAAESVIVQTQMAAHSGMPPAGFPDYIPEAPQMDPEVLAGITIPQAPVMDVPDIPDIIPPHVSSADGSAGTQGRLFTAQAEDGRIIRFEGSGSVYNASTVADNGEEQRWTVILNDTTGTTSFVKYQAATENTPEGTWIIEKGNGTDNVTFRSTAAGNREDAGGWVYQGNSNEGEWIHAVHIPGEEENGRFEFRQSTGGYQEIRYTQTSRTDGTEEDQNSRKNDGTWTFVQEIKEGKPAGSGQYVYEKAENGGIWNMTADAGTGKLEIMYRDGQSAGKEEWHLINTGSARENVWIQKPQTENGGIFIVRQDQTGAAKREMFLSGESGKSPIQIFNDLKNGQMNVLSEGNLWEVRSGTVSFSQNGENLIPGEWIIGKNQTMFKTKDGIYEQLHGEAGNRTFRFSANNETGDGANSFILRESGDGRWFAERPGEKGFFRMPLDEKGTMGYAEFIKSDGPMESFKPNKNVLEALKNGSGSKLENYFRKQIESGKIHVTAQSMMPANGIGRFDRLGVAVGKLIKYYADEGDKDSVMKRAKEVMLRQDVIAGARAFTSLGMKSSVQETANLVQASFTKDELDMFRKIAERNKFGTIDLSDTSKLQESIESMNSVMKRIGLAESRTSVIGGSFTAVRGKDATVDSGFMDRAFRKLKEKGLGEKLVDPGTTSKFAAAKLKSELESAGINLTDKQISELVAKFFRNNTAQKIATTSQYIKMSKGALLKFASPNPITNPLLSQSMRNDPTMQAMQQGRSIVSAARTGYGFVENALDTIWMLRSQALTTKIQGIDSTLGNSKLLSRDKVKDLNAKRAKLLNKREKFKKSSERLKDFKLKRTEAKTKVAEGLKKAGKDALKTAEKGLSKSKIGAKLVENTKAVKAAIDAGLKKLAQSGVAKAIGTAVEKAAEFLSGVGEIVTLILIVFIIVLVVLSVIAAAIGVLLMLVMTPLLLITQFTGTDTPSKDVSVVEGKVINAEYSPMYKTYYDLLEMEGEWNSRIQQSMKGISPAEAASLGEFGYSLIDPSTGSLMSGYGDLSFQEYLSYQEMGAVPYAKGQTFESTAYTTSNPAVNKYNLTIDQCINFFAALCRGENGSALTTEMSQLLNLYEAHNKRRDLTLQELVVWVLEDSNNGKLGSHSGTWYKNSSRYLGIKASEKDKAAILSVLNGQRTVPANVVEHDFWGDIAYIETNGVKYSPKDRSHYVSGVTVVYQAKPHYEPGIKFKCGIAGNKNGHWIFFCFPEEGSDPFGYLCKGKCNHTNTYELIR